MIPRSVKAPTIPIPFHRMLKVVAIVDPANVQAKELIELIFEQPYCKIRFVEKAGIAKRLTATKYLRALEKAGFVVPTKRGTELIFINHRLWRLLTTEPLPKRGEKAQR